MFKQISTEVTSIVKPLFSDSVNKNPQINKLIEDKDTPKTELAISKSVETALENYKTKEMDKERRQLNQL